MSSQTEESSVHERIVQGILNGERRMAARAISLIENEDPNKNKIMSELYPHTGKAQIWRRQAGNFR